MISQQPMPDPVVFDPAAYVAELRAAGYFFELGRDGEHFFVFNDEGFGDDHTQIQEKWHASKKGSREWIKQVARVLKAERDAILSRA